MGLDFSLLPLLLLLLLLLVSEGVQAVRGDREGGPRQLRQGVWQACRYRRRRRPEPSKAPPARPFHHSILRQLHTLRLLFFLFSIVSF